MATEPENPLRRVAMATKYSLDGIAAAWRVEQPFRLEVYCFIIAAPLGWWLGENGIQRALLIGSLLLVLIMEMVNSAIEAVVDRVGTERHELSKRAKDMGSGAVFLSLINAGMIWGLILYDAIRL